MTNWSNVHVLQIGKYYAAVFYLFTLWNLNFDVLRTYPNDIYVCENKTYNAYLSKLQYALKRYENSHSSFDDPRTEYHSWT
jgi:hypothetical protein